MKQFDLQSCLNGDELEWARFVESTAGLIIAAVRQVCGRSSQMPEATAIDDIVQDVFLRLVKDDFRLLRTYDPSRAALSTWLTLVARSTTIDRLRRKRLPTFSIESFDAPVERDDEGGMDPDGESIPLQILTERQRLVLSMLFDEELTVSEAAIRLDVDEQTVRSTKHKALSRLRAHYQASSVDGTPEKSP